MLDRRENGRQRIIEGAMQILDGGPLADFTVDSLARNLHMSKSTLYKYFESKDHVVVTLVEIAMIETLDGLKSHDFTGGRSAAEALEGLIDVLASHADRVPAAVLIAMPDLPPEAAAHIVKVRLAVREHLEAVLTRGRRAGEFTVPYPKVAAAAYQEALEEGVMVSARGEVDLSRGDALRAVHLMIANGLVATA